MTTFITLTRDAHAVALRQIRKAQEALGTLGAVLASRGMRPLDPELPRATLKVAEFELAHLCTTLGIETDSSREREERFAMLRQANVRVRELEGQLGNALGRTSCKRVSRPWPTGSTHGGAWRGLATSAT